MKTLRSSVSAFLGLFLALVIAVGSFGVLFGQAPGHAAPQIGPDKYMHAGVSVGLGLVARSQIKDPVLAWSAAMVPGLVKEVWDAKRKGGTGFSRGDLLADAIGAYVGVKVGGLMFSSRSIHYTKDF